MKRFLLATTALAALLAPAAAADLPVKAPAPSRVVFPFDGSGWYFGAESFVTQQTVNLATPVPGVSGTINATGASIGVVGGYTKHLGNGLFVAGECDASAQNLGGSNAAGGPLAMSFSGPWRVGCLAKFGAPWDQITAAIPNVGFQFPMFTPPAGVTKTPAHLYLAAGAAGTDISAQWQLQQASEWSLAGRLRTGAIWQLASGAAVDTWVEYEGPGRSLGFGATGGPAFTPAIAGQARSWKVGGSYLF